MWTPSFIASLLSAERNVDGGPDGGYRARRRSYATWTSPDRGLATGDRAPAGANAGRDARGRALGADHRGRLREPRRRRVPDARRPSPGQAHRPARLRARVGPP